MSAEIDPAYLSLEMRARIISDAGAGVYPVSKMRAVIYDVALQHLREIAEPAPEKRR